MIKINLNKTKSHVFQDTQSTGVAPSGATLTTALKNFKFKKYNIEPAVYVKMTFNLIFIFCFPLGLKIYEIDQINKLEVQKAQKEKLKTSAEAKLAGLTKEIEGYSHIQDKADEFATKKDFLKDLAEIRLVIPRIIDFIQNNILEDVWLKNLKLELSEKKGTLNISGESFSEDNINFFANSMFEILDRNTVTVNMQDMKGGKNKVSKINFTLNGRIKE